MKLIDRHVAWSVFVSLAMGVFVLTFVLVMGNVFKELLDMMVNKNLPLNAVVAFIFLALPFCLVFTIPWAFLAAVLLVFGRLSADNELLALRASGVGLHRISIPVFLIAVVLSVICLWINVDIGPRAKERMFSIISGMGTSDPMSLFTPGDVIDQYAGMRLFVGGKMGDTLTNVTMVEMDDQNIPLRVTVAKRCDVTIEPGGTSLLLHLTDAQVEERQKSDPLNPSKLPRSFAMKESVYRLDLAKLLRLNRKNKHLSSYTLPDLRAFIAEGAEGQLLKAEIEYHMRFSMALASLAFSLVAIPLGIVAHRRETTVGFGLSLILAFTYFFFITMAQALQNSPAWHPKFFVWLPNILFGIVGSILFFRACRR